jgi:hypothetical protein
MTRYHFRVAIEKHPRAVATLVAARHQEDTVPELLPCPFCGGKARLYSEDDDYAVEHAGCSISHDEVFNDADSAIAAWNRRAATSAPRPSGAVPQDGSAVEVAERITEIRRHHEVASTPEARGMSAAEWARQHATLAHWERGDLLEIAAALLARIHQLNDAFEWHDIPVPGKVEP